jgi:hypothetical protein
LERAGSNRHPASTHPEAVREQFVSDVNVIASAEVMHHQEPARYAWLERMEMRTARRLKQLHCQPELVPVQSSEQT